MTDPRQELQRVVDGHLGSVNLLRLAKDTGYDRHRLREIAQEMGLHVWMESSKRWYSVSLPPVEGEGRKE